MSKQEDHPLDAHFRRMLAQAEATPPPSVWQAIRHARQGRERGGGLRRGWVMFVLLVGMSTLIGLGIHQYPGTTARQETGHHPAGRLGEADPTVRQAVKVVPPSHADRLSGGPGNALGTKRDPAGPVSTAGTDHRERLAGLRPANEAAAQGGTERGMDTGIRATAGPGNTARDRGSATLPTPSLKQAEGASPPSPVPATVVLDRAEPAMGPSFASPRMDVQMAWIQPRQVHLDHGPPPIGPLPASTNMDRYTQPHGEWWVALQGSVYDLRYHWKGPAEQAASRLDEAGATTSTLGLGLTAGYRWGSQWSLASGVQLERFEQSFDHTERTIDVDQEIITYVVTLNTQVFVSEVDTITTVTTEEQRIQGNVRRSITRIPLEFQWRGHFRRWGLGPTLGLATEFTTHQEGYGLGVDPDEDRLVARWLESTELQQRHPAALLATAGVDISYMLSERWEVGTRPHYMRGVLALGRTGPVYALPERWGLHFQITHHFLRQRSK